MSTCPCLSIGKMVVTHFINDISLHDETEDKKKTKKKKLAKAI